MHGVSRAPPRTPFVHGPPRRPCPKRHRRLRMALLCPTPVRPPRARHGCIGSTRLLLPAPPCPFARPVARPPPLVPRPLPATRAERLPSAGTAGVSALSRRSDRERGGRLRRPGPDRSSHEPKRGRPAPHAVGGDSSILARPSSAHLHPPNLHPSPGYRTDAGTTGGPVPSAPTDPRRDTGHGACAAGRSEAVRRPLRARSRPDRRGTTGSPIAFREPVPPSPHSALRSIPRRHDVRNRDPAPADPGARVPFQGHRPGRTSSCPGGVAAERADRSGDPRRERGGLGPLRPG